MFCIRRKDVYYVLLYEKWNTISPRPYCVAKSHGVGRSHLHSLQTYFQKVNILHLPSKCEGLPFLYLPILLKERIDPLAKSIDIF